MDNYLCVIGFKRIYLRYIRMTNKTRLRSLVYGASLVFVFIFSGLLSPYSAQGYTAPKQGGLPDERQIVADVAKEHPDWLANKYDPYENPDGTWQFLDEVIKRLHTKDPRWVYNGKRGDPKNPSHDFIAYYYGPGQSPTPGTEHMFEVYGVDIATYGQSATHWSDDTSYSATPCVYGSYLYPRNAPAAVPPLPETPASCDTGGTGTSPGSGGSDDPVVPPPIPKDKSTTDATAGWAGNLAYNSTANNWLVVSQDGQKKIAGQLMSNDGKRIGSPIKVSGTLTQNLAPRVGYAPDINKFLVIWLRENGNTDLTLYGQFVSADGTLSGSPIAIDRGTFLLHANTSVEYDSVNKQFVFVLENRASGVQVALNTLSTSGQPGTRVNVTTSSNGTFNGAPSVAVNGRDGQYCVMYQHVEDSIKNSGSEVTVVPVSISARQVGQPSVLIDNSQFTYNIVYNSQENEYMGIWASADETELQGKIFSGCKGNLEEDPLFIGENYHNGNLAYNSKSNSYAAVVQEHDTNDNHLYVINSSGGVLYESTIFSGSEKGNFGPRIAGNTTTGLYAATTSEGYATTKFASNLGGSDLLIQTKPRTGFPAAQGIPVPDDGLPTDLGQLIEAIFNWSLGLIGLVIFVRFFWAGLKWFSAGGNPGPIREAQTIMWNAVYGAVILFSAYLILNTINPDLVRSTFTLPGFSAGQAPSGAAGTGTGSTETGTGRTGTTTSATCSNTTALAAKYNTPSTAKNDPKLDTLIACIKGKLPGVNFGSEFTVDQSHPLCNITRGNTECSGTCSHTLNSCHYGGKNGTGGSLAVDFGNEKEGDKIIQAALACGVPSAKARCESSAGVRVTCSDTSATHVHISEASCDAN